MTTHILKQAIRFLNLIIISDKFVRVFSVTERNNIRAAHDAIESATHYPE